MQNSTKQIGIFLMIILAFVVSPIQAIDKIENVESVTTVNSKDDLVGGWEYTVAGAPEGFDSGLMMIVKVDKVYKVQVQTEAGTFNGSDVVVKGSKLTFNISIEGENVAVSLAVKGSAMTGTSTSSTGVFNITGTKIISPE